ncbi:hypothetical protein R6Q57_009400 [Mikania cordata]
MAHFIKANEQQTIVNEAVDQGFALLPAVIASSGELESVCPESSVAGGPFLHERSNESTSVRNEAQMKCRFKRLSENGQKWVAAYTEAYRHRKSGMNHKDIESEAHKLYEQDRRNKFTDYILDQDTRRSRLEESNEESGGSSKSRTTKQGEYCANPNTETQLVVVQHLNVQLVEMQLKKSKRKRNIQCFY